MSATAGTTEAQPEPERRPDPGAGEAPLRILVPVFNDWQAVGALVPALDAALARAGLAAELTLVDDGSDLEQVGGAGASGTGTRAAFGSASLAALPPLAALARVEVLRLRCNLGHQRAIAVGLGALAARPRPAPVVVMDGDGEDRPDDVPRLVAAMREAGGRAVVFARRARRAESLLFRACYLAYRGLMSALAGQDIRVGNFSAIPAALLPRVVALSDLWNQYAAAVVRHRVGVMTVPIDRGRRLAGQPKMSLTALVVHGLGAISIFADVIGARLLIAGGTLAALVLALAALAALAAVLAPGALPPRSFAALGLAGLAVLQLVTIALVAAIATLQGRRTKGFLPYRDHADYVARTDVVRGAS